MGRQVRALGGLCGLAALLVTSTVLRASTVAECTPSSAKDRVGSAPAAVSAWESANRAQLSPPAREQVLVDLCKAFQAAAAEPGRTPAALSAAAETAVKDHLDRELDPKQTPRSVAASLRSALGLSGYSRPTNRKLAVVEVAGPQGGQVEVAWTSKDGKQVARTLVGTPGRVMFPEGSLALTVKKSLGSCQPSARDVDGGSAIRFSCQ